MGKAKITSVKLNESLSVKVGDSVIVKPEGGGDLPFVGKIRAFTRLSGKNRVEGEDYKILVAWYYRPEEALGRKVFHGAQELFRSDHEDEIFSSTVEHKCRVHSLQAYQTLEKRTEVDFFTRLKFIPGKEEFFPESLPIYCVCGMPYNPDRYMVQCASCFEWYHPDCLPEGVRHKAKKDAFFTCGDCLTRPSGGAVKDPLPARTMAMN